MSSPLLQCFHEEEDLAYLSGNRKRNEKQQIMNDRTDRPR